ncbi:L-fucose kinase, partial [Araneus ventricosus]
MNENWSCIVITCPSLSSVVATEREVEFLKKKGRIPSCICVLTIEDPAKNLGSGAATLNALLLAVEYLSAKQNYMVLTSDVLFGSRILILHNGRDYLYSCSGKAFISLPLEYVSEDKSKPYCSGILNNLEAAFQLIGELSSESPYGVWVCSTDMLILQKEKSYTPVMWENVADVVMFCIHADIEYATGHGVISIDNQGYVSDIFYCQPFDQIKNFAQGDGKVPIPGNDCFILFGIQENPFLPVNFDQGTFCNKPWSKIFKQLCVEEDEIWASDLGSSGKTLMNAKLFTCNLSLKEALDLFLNESEASNSDLTK